MKRSSRKSETWVAGERREADRDGYILRNEMEDIKPYFVRPEPNDPIQRNIQFRLARTMQVELRNAHTQPGRIGEYGQ